MMIFHVNIIDYVLLYLVKFKIFCWITVLSIRHNGSLSNEIFPDYHQCRSNRPLPFLMYPTRGTLLNISQLFTNSKQITWTIQKVLSENITLNEGFVLRIIVTL